VGAPDRLAGGGQEVTATVQRPHPCISLQGGTCFHEPTEVLFRGAILGGTAPRTGWLLAGYRMALWSSYGHVVTWPFRSIEMELDSLHGPSGAGVEFSLGGHVTAPNERHDRAIPES
jgi:hypothetical protein